jgi:hypothetical protein
VLSDYINQTSMENNQSQNVWGETNVEKVDQLTPGKLFIIRLKEAAIKATQDTTGHGLPRIVENKGIVLRLLWFFAILASIGGCAYMIYDGMDHYFSWKVVTSIRVIGEAPSLFPVNSLLYRKSLFFR